MKTPTEILRAVSQVGGRLEPAGDKLRMLLPSDCPPALKDVIRQHKVELLDLLEAHASNLSPDSGPWLHVARQVVEGEFDTILDDSVSGSLKIGLRSVPHPICQRALAQLQKQQNN